MVEVGIEVNVRTIETMRSKRRLEVAMTTASATLSMLVLRRFQSETQRFLKNLLRRLSLGIRASRPSGTRDVYRVALSLAALVALVPEVSAAANSISANPNPIQLCDGSGLGATMLTWTSGATTVEVHVNSPAGALFARSGAGTWSSATGKWVANGTVFYLQDVSGGLPLTSANTLATVTVALTTNGCSGTISANPNPIQVCDSSGFGTTMVTWNSGATAVEVHVNAPGGALLARSGPGPWSATTGKWVADGTVFYLQDVSAGMPLTSANTLATVTVRLTANGCPGTISANPNPIQVCDGSGLGVTTLKWTSAASAVEVHVNAPNGAVLARSGQGTWSATTGKWVTSGTIFYLQDVSSGQPASAANTIATVTATLTTDGCPLPVRPSITASPNPIATCDNSTAGVATVTWNSGSVTAVEVHVNSPTGPLFASSGVGTSSAQTGKWVTDGTVFFLQDVSGGAPLTSAHTLARASVSVTQEACLASLTVSPLTLRPSFSPSVHDYAVVCNSGTNTLTLTFGAVAGGLVALSDPTPTTWATAQSVSVSLEQDDAAVVLAQGPNGVITDYWIRCLPNDFPLVSPRTNPSVGNPTPGWYFIGNVVVAAGSGRFAMVVDANGTPLWYHRTGATSASPAVVTPLPDSTIGIVTNNPAIGTLFHLAAGTTQPINTVGVPLDTHELRLLPNGNYMLTSYPILSGVDLTGLATYGPNSKIIDCVVQEVDPQGNLVWEWRGSDHIDPVRESTVPAGTTFVDVFHCNSVDVNSNGDVLVSFRNADTLYFISKATGDIVWKLGGTAYSKDGAQIITIQGDPETAFYRQHDARFRPNGTATVFNVSLFDDHSPLPNSNVPGPARGVEYQIDLTNGTATVVWQYQGAASTGALGSFRRYADGTNLICWGFSNGTDNLVFSDLDNAGNDPLDMLFEKRGNWSYRAEKVPIGTIDIELLRATAGLP